MKFQVVFQDEINLMYESQLTKVWQDCSLNLVFAGSFAHSLET